MADFREYQPSLMAIRKTIEIDPELPGGLVRTSWRKSRRLKEANSMPGK
jgi:hypothetical protein